MRRAWSWRAVLVAVLGATALIGCAGAEPEVSADELGALALRRAESSRRFESTQSFGGATLVIRGLVEDDYRYSASVEADGRLLWEEVAIDDRRWVRVPPDAAPHLFPESIGTRLLALHPAFGDVLSGRWVLEPDGAPVEFGEQGARPLTGPLGPALVLEQVRLLEGVPSLAGLGFSAYDPESLNHLRKNDRFPPHEQDGVRFDHLPSSYDPNAVMVTLASLRPSFEFLSLWARPDGLTRIERLLDLPDPGDRGYKPLYDQLRRAGSTRLRTLIALGRPAFTVRESYVVAPAAGEVVVAPDGAVEADVTEALRALQIQVGVPPPTPLYGPIE